ncbi:MAG: SCP2 sterol-binding domain-containing protein [Candidatus Lokiarchaeota archaeon]|nr:SCP2 sterol-binding domain-containing protein [Candidatus Lokiarchaeota archaeon]
MQQQNFPLFAMMTALFSMYITGLGLIIISLMVGVQLPIGNIYYYLSLAVFVLGFLIILIGILVSLRFFIRIFKIVDIFAEKGFLVEESQETVYKQPLRIFRQKMPESIPEDQISKSNSKPATFKSAITEPVPIMSTSKPKPAEESTDITPTISLEEALQSIVDRYNDEKVKKSFKGWNETLVMRFPDIDKNFMYVINGDEEIQFTEGDNAEAAVQVEMDSTLFQKLIAKQVNAIKAYSSGKMNVSGQMKNMLKLRKLMF